MDKKGVAVALTFLVAIFFGIRECSETKIDQVHNALQEQPAKRSLQGQANR